MMRLVRLTLAPHLRCRHRAGGRQQRGEGGAGAGVLFEDHPG